MGAISAAKQDRINYVNIGLMLISCAVALCIPFELFLFAYAVLGPAHYLTEISWLQKRSFFTRGKHDFWLLGAIALGVCFVAPWSPLTATLTFLALGSALVLVLLDRTVPRILAMAPVVLVALAMLDANGFLILLVGMFVPTLIHVYVFTGFFMIYGSLKERSRSGYLAFCVFLLCPLACLLINPGGFRPSTHTMVSYWNLFSPLNMAILGVEQPHTPVEGRKVLALIFSSHTGLIVMRFIAFAYTYHYLNWFSKTSIIRWHESGAKRLAAIAALWLTSVGIYFYDFPLGFRILLYLSVTHVYLEFPLNHLSIMGTFRELRSMMGRPLEPALMGAGKDRA